jgi:hypothetical protein
MLGKQTVDYGGSGSEGMGAVDGTNGSMNVEGIGCLSNPKMEPQRVRTVVHPNPASMRLDVLQQYRTWTSYA